MQNVRTEAQACDESTNRARTVASVANDWVVEADSASNFVRLSMLVASARLGAPRAVQDVLCVLVDVWRVSSFNGTGCTLQVRERH